MRHIDTIAENNTIHRYIRRNEYNTLIHSQKRIRYIHTIAEKTNNTNIHSQKRVQYSDKLADINTIRRDFRRQK